MGTNDQAFPSSGRISFANVKAAALQALPSLVQQWLPDGRREQNEWVARNPTRVDNSPGSFKINLLTGVWSDFATSESGGDPIDLWAYLKHKTPLDSARDLADMLNVKSEGGSISQNGNAGNFGRKERSIAASPECARTAPAAFPPRTAPGKDGKPRFIAAAENGPRVGKDEKRRHVYRAGGVPVHIKIMRNGDANPFNVYRVIKEGVQGWQYGKPEGFQAVPYIVAADNPFEPQNTKQPVFWPEGEKDVESLALRGAYAFTFGGTGDGLPQGCEQYVTGRAVAILADNDDGGRRHAEQKAALAATVAARVQIIHFPELGNKKDVSDWFEAGHTI
jgi:putative DNA primase/helicase